MSLSHFIARRLYQTGDGQGRISRPAVLIAMLGISVGVLVMIVSIAVAYGFKREVTAKVVGFGSDIQLLSLTQTQDYVMMPVVTSDSLLGACMSVGGIRRIDEFAQVVGMIKTDDNFRAVQFKGLDSDYDMEFFRQYIQEGQLPDLSGKADTGPLFISRTIADELSLGVGDKVATYFLTSGNMRARKMRVCGIYQTNLTDYDKNIVITDIHTVRKLNGWQDDESSGYQISVTDFSQVQAITDRLVAVTGHHYDRNGATYGAFSIQELVPSIFSWLGVLDMNVVMILVLMTVVSIFTIMSGLLIVMLERINMVGILKALGATDHTVRKIFMHAFLRVVGEGMMIGNVVALLILVIQHYFHPIQLDASVYYIDFVPVQFEWGLFLAVDAATLIISALVIFGSTYFMSLAEPADTIRYE